jgi:hypothetical protein
VLEWAQEHVSKEAICDKETREAALGLAAILAREVPAVAWALLESISAESDDAARLLLTNYARRPLGVWLVSRPGSCRARRAVRPLASILPA